MDKNTTENFTLDIKRQTHSFIQGVVLAAIVLPGVVGNVFALIITTRLLKLREHRLSPNIFAFGLTTIDLFAVVGISAPSLICYVAGEWVGGVPLCKFQGFLALFCSLASGGVAVSMAVERYISVASPLRYRTKISASLAKKVLVAVVTGTATLSLMPVGGIGNFVKAASGTFCTFDWFAKRLEDVVYSYIIVVYSTILIATLVFCNANIIFKLFQSTKRRQRTLSELGSEKEISLSSMKRTIEWQFGKMMFFISAIFLLCWIPFTVSLNCLFFS